MTALDDKLLPRIKKTIEKFGREVTFKDVLHKAGTYAASTGKTTGASAADCRNVKVTPLDFEVRRWDPRFEISEASAMTMVAGDGLAFVPVKNGKVEISEGTDSVVWTIVRVRNISPGEKVGAYMLFLKA